MTRSVRPWYLKRRTSLIRRIDNLWVGIGLPHGLNEKSVARLSCRPKRPAPPKRCSRSPEIAAHDALKSLLTIPRNACSRSSEIRAHDPLKRASLNLAPLKLKSHCVTDGEWKKGLLRPALTTARD